MMRASRVECASKRSFFSKTWFLSHVIASKPRLQMKGNFGMRKLTVCATRNGGCLEFCRLKSGARALHETGRGKGISIARDLLSPSLFVRLILFSRLIPAYEL